MSSSIQGSKSVLVTNDQLAAGVQTSISESGSGKLITSGAVHNVADLLLDKTINFGGVSLKLTQSDTTPAFNLSDATNYACSALTGTISNSQLANSSVSLGGISIALGGSDATPAFNLSDATSYACSALTGAISNSQLASGVETGNPSHESANLITSGAVYTTTNIIQSTATSLAARVSALEARPKIFAACKYNGSNDTISYANNITDNSSYPEKIGTGHYKFQLITAHSTAQYVIVATIIETGDKDTVVQVVSGQQTSSTFEIIINEDAPGNHNTGTARDRVFMFICVGE